MLRSLGLLTLACLGGLRPVYAGPCDTLSNDGKKLTKKLFQVIRPYDCCDETLEQCLKQKKVCRLAQRLRDDICRRVAKGHDENSIKTIIEQRARSMMPMGKKATFDLSLTPAAGEVKAPVSVVAYACTRCPLCAREIPDLHRLVTSDVLKGKVKLYLRPYPIKSHSGAVEGGEAFITAARLKQFWPFVIKVFTEFDNFSVERLPDWAASVGMNKEDFRRESTASQTRNLLVESKKEGLRNGVNATPTLFINGRKYTGPLEPDYLIDILEEEVDHMTGKKY